MLRHINYYKKLEGNLLAADAYIPSNLIGLTVNQPLLRYLIHFLHLRTFDCQVYNNYHVELSFQVNMCCYQWNGKFFYSNIETASLRKSGSTFHGADFLQGRLDYYILKGIPRPRNVIHMYTGSFFTGFTSCPAGLLIEM